MPGSKQNDDLSSGHFLSTIQISFRIADKSVHFLNGGLNNRPHNWTQGDLNNRLVYYSDPHCTRTLNPLLNITSMYNSHLFQYKTQK